MADTGPSTTATTTGPPQVRVDASRLVERIEALGEIGPISGRDGERGSCRLALTDADRDGRDLVVGWMHDLGLEVAVDRIGNVTATLPGRDRSLAAVMTGSHIDTVRTGGRFDGVLGVLAGLEVIETLIAAGIETERDVTAAFFTDEEGSRFAPDMLGSLVYVGGLGLEQALDITAIDGARLGDELDRIGYAGTTPCPTAHPPRLFVELHIEQGPVLEDEAVEIGVVEGVQGISWTEVTIVGQSAHAGTTPMSLRHDPAVVAAEIVVVARRLAAEVGGSQVATVGRIDVTPNLVNVVPSQAVLTVDLRNTDDERLREAERRLAESIAELAANEGVDASLRTLARFEPVVFDTDTVDRVERSAESLGYSTRRMHSGAGHDAQMLARICPTAMIFVPSVAGLSHNPAEFTDVDDIERGANVLLRVLLDEMMA